VNTTGPGSCSVVDFAISSVEPLATATRELISKMGFSEIGCEDRRWTEI